MGRVNVRDESCDPNNLNVESNNRAIETHLNNIPSNESSEPRLREIVDQLVELGYNGSQTDTEGNTPLYYAVKNGYGEIVKVLLTHYADFDITDTIFSTPLQIEQEIGSSIFEESKYENFNLLQIVNQKDNDGKSLLCIAVARESYDIACELILHGSDISSINREHQKDLLLYASRQTHVAYCRQNHELRSVVGLLAMKVPEAVSNFSADYQYPRLLSYFLLKGHTKVVDAILSPVIDPQIRVKILDQGDNHVTPLDRVNPHSKSDLSDEAHLKINKYLLDNGATKCCNDLDHIYRILLSAALNGHLKTFKYLAEQADKKHFNTYIGIATIDNHMNIVEYLWENYRRYTTDYAGNTALLYAADRGGLQSIKYLVENGAVVNQANAKGQTPLHFALEERRREVIRYLLCQDAHCHCNAGITCIFPIVT